MKILLALRSLCFVIFICDHFVFSKPSDYRQDLDSGKYGSYPVHEYISTKLRAPHVNFLQWTPECDDDRYYFVTPRGWKVPNPGPMILSGEHLVWFKHFSNSFGGQAYDLKVQRYAGEDYLTFWLGDDTVRGHGFGQYYMLNASYDIVYEVGAANGLHADLHDFVITSEGTGLLLIYQNKRADVRSVGRKFNDLWNQAIWDCVFQEIDIKSGNLIFEWRASEHLNLTLTYHELDSKIGDSGTQTNPFDWFHGNSIEKDELGNYLISARNLHAIFYIDGRTKDIIWTLGGKNNSFQDLSEGHALNFAWQHDARFIPSDALPEAYRPPVPEDGSTTRLMTLFDNAAMDWKYEYGPSYSRTLLLELTYPTPGIKTHRDLAAKSADVSGSHGTYLTQWPEAVSSQDQGKLAVINGKTSTYTVRVVREFKNPMDTISSTQGSAQILSQESSKDSKILVGYGINAVMTEFSSNGSVICDIHFGAASAWETGDVQSYRAFKFPWIGQPRQPPSVTVRRNKVFVSWNGATEHVEWVLQAADNPHSDAGWTDMARVPKQGFETIVPLPIASEGPSLKYLRVMALDRNGLPCKNGIREVFQPGGLLSWTQDRISSIRSDSWTPLILLFGFIAVSVLLARFFRIWLPRRRRRLEGRVLPSQHLD